MINVLNEHEKYFLMDDRYERAVRNNAFLAPLSDVNTINMPRQARDKHKKQP
jgi:hypothetical protein